VGNACFPSNSSLEIIRGAVGAFVVDNLLASSTAGDDRGGICVPTFVLRHIELGPADALAGIRFGVVLALVLQAGNYTHRVVSGLQDIVQRSFTMSVFARAADVLIMGTVVGPARRLCAGGDRNEDEQRSEAHDHFASAEAASELKIEAVKLAYANSIRVVRTVDLINEMSPTMSWR
jgi:hypothetical protein